MAGAHAPDRGAGGRAHDRRERGVAGADVVALQLELARAQQELRIAQGERDGAAADAVNGQRRLAAMAVDMENLQTELHVKRRQLSRLEHELQREREAAVSEPILEALFRFWHLSCKRGHANVKFGKKRREAVVARLREGFTPAQLANGIVGAQVAAFEKDGVRFDDLELICRDEVHLERFIKRRDAYENYQRDRREAGLPFEHDPDLNDADIDRQLEADRLYVWLQHETERNATDHA